jgi:RNA polymerase sigma-70 factor (ECF subfamily)
MRFSVSMNTAVAEVGATEDDRRLLEEPMDKAAFEALYQQTASKLWAYIRRASGDAALADDIFQETFLRFLRVRLPQLEPNQMRAYLYRTATTLLVDHWRRSKRTEYWSLDALLGKSAPAEPPLGGDVMRFYAQLKPQEQALLWLAYVEGFDHREIAAALQLRERSVRVLLFRARKKMAGVLTEAGLGPQEGP